ncbi:MAG: cobalamin-dependent protein [Candidatus Omnitrophica bacterium]|nr:cobalamin-dependent protein [Candidatus Omnitrophota bacterium]
MKKVLLIFASAKVKGNYINNLPPVGLFYLASALKKGGFTVSICDCSVDDFSLRGIAQYDCVGFSVNISNFENTVKLIKKVKNASKTALVVVGGPLPSVSPEIFFPLELDAVFIGESEASFIEYLNLKNPKQSRNRGYYFKDSQGEWKFNGDYPFIEDLDGLSFPLFTKEMLKKYYTPVKKKSPVSIMISSRGCPYHCTFCCKILGSKFRMRSAENVVNEIKWQVDSLGAKEIVIYDDNFTLNKQRVIDICDLIISQRIEVSLQLTNGVRVDTLDLELLKKMKQAGVWMIGIAPESGDEKTLEKIEKKFDLDQVVKVRNWCLGQNIKVWSFFMVGFPWEDRALIRKTIDFALRLDADISQFSQVTPLPKTKLYDDFYSKKRSETFENDISLFHVSGRLTECGLRPKELKKMIGRAYWKIYFKPKKMLRLLRIFKITDLIRLSGYTIRSLLGGSNFKKRDS